MTANEIVITHAVRTPIGKFLGSLKPKSAIDLGAHAIHSVLERSGIDAADLGEVVMGQARQLGSGPNPARQAAIAAGVPDTVPAMTVNKACGSSLMAIWSVCRAITLGEFDVAVAGGMESMTNIPFLLPKMRHGYRLGHDKVLDGNYKDGFDCPLAGVPMGMTAEYLADKYEISREEQDQYAVETFHRWQAAEDAGRFANERAAIELVDRKNNKTLFDTDEHGRRDVTLEGLAKLRPVFRPEGGTVHPGNASGITDGAAAVLVMTREQADARGLPVLARIGRAKTAGVAPEHMGIAPVPAIRNLTEELGITVDGFDLIELNEAFAAQVLACDRELSLPRDRLNVNGGAIALGHPIGATGARIVVTLLHEMQRADAKLGLASLCMSGGLGMAVSFHR